MSLRLAKLQESNEKVQKLKAIAKLVKGCKDINREYLALWIRKVGYFIALIFGTQVEFLDLLFLDLLDKCITILLVLPSTLTTSLLSAVNAFKAKFNDLIAFNSNINSAVILLKP